MLVTQLCTTLHNPVDCNLTDCSVRGILQSRIPEWVAIFFSRGFSWPRDWTHVAYIAGRFFTVWAIREAHGILIFILKGMGIYLRVLRNRTMIDCPFWIYYYNFDYYYNFEFLRIPLRCFPLISNSYNLGVFSIIVFPIKKDSAN